jgi:hypothetical protein
LCRLRHFPVSTHTMTMDARTTTTAHARTDSGAHFHARLVSRRYLLVRRVYSASNRRRCLDAQAGLLRALTRSVAHDRRATMTLSQSMTHVLPVQQTARGGLRRQVWRTSASMLYYSPKASGGALPDRMVVTRSAKTPQRDSHVLCLSVSLHERRSPSCA